MLKIYDLDAYYGHLQVLHKVSLEVNEGELVTFIGANGAGKTTLLMSICGMVKQISGAIEFMGRRINALPPHIIVSLGIIQVPQERLLFSQMTVAENLELGTRQADLKTKSLEQRLEEVYNLFEVLRTRRDQKAGTLSGGEQTMLAIARGLMVGPKLLLLDEPSSALAPIIVEMLAETIDNIHKKGLTIVLVEQDAHLALELADRGYVLQSGAIVASGNTSELAQSEKVKQAYLGA